MAALNPQSPSLSREPTTGRTRKFLTTAGDVSVTVLQTLRDIAAFAPVPLLGPAAETAIHIIQVIQNCEQNRDKLLELANDVYNLLLVIHEVCKATVEQTATIDTTSVQKLNMDALSPEMQDMLKTLSRTLDGVRIFIEECQKNSTFFGRLIHYKSINEGIEHYRGEMKNILRLVQFRSNLVMHRKVDELKRSLERPLQSTESLPTTPEQTPPLSRSTLAPESDSINGSGANLRGNALFDSIYGVEDTGSSQPDDERHRQVPPSRHSSQSERYHPTDHLHPFQRYYGHQAPHRASPQPRSRRQTPSPYYDDRDFARPEEYYRPYNDHIPPSYSPWGGFTPFPVNNVGGDQVNHTNYGNNTTSIGCGNSYTTTNYN